VGREDKTLVRFRSQLEAGKNLGRFRPIGEPAILTDSVKMAVSFWHCHFGRYCHFGRVRLIEAYPIFWHCQATIYKSFTVRPLAVRLSACPPVRLDAVSGPP
jgi:hypothetical protein